jgi:hypothetical protein
VRVVREGSNLLLYASARPDLSVQGIFAESEQHSLAPNNRPPVNEAFLPPGRYRAEIALTEESFHGYGDSGFWATVMSGVVEFDVVDRPRPTPYWTALESQGFRLSLSRAAVENIRADRCTDAELAGAAITDKPVIAFAEEFNLSPGRRHVLALEFRSRGRQAWQVYVDRGQELSLKPEYYVESDGRGGWQRFELEITSQARGYLRIAPTNRAEKIGVRNVGIHPVKE